MRNAFEQRYANDVRGLELIHRFNWLRTLELGKLMWPNDRFSRTRADRIARSWLQRRLVLQRGLPDGAGRALVLSAAGARLLRAANVDAHSGKDVGETVASAAAVRASGAAPQRKVVEWAAPAQWRHDLLAAGVLAELKAFGYEVYPDPHIRREEPHLTKFPDGLAVRGRHVIWVEVERTKKSAKPGRDLAEALAIVVSGQSKPVLKHLPNDALVVYLPEQRNQLGHRVDHRANILKAVSAKVKRRVGISFAKVELLGTAGVGSVEFTAELVQSNEAVEVLRRMNANGWHKQQDGTLAATYGEWRGFVWDDGETWSYQVTHRGVEQPANYASGIAEAKRCCAEAIAAGGNRG